jgi:hypothetical protein
VVATTGVVSTAEAAPTQTAEVFVCDGEETTIFTTARNRWVDGVKYQAFSFSIEGRSHPPTATRGRSMSPRSGGAGISANADAITCTVEISEQSDEGLFEAQLEVIVVAA